MVKLNVIIIIQPNLKNLLLIVEKINGSKVSKEVENLSLFNTGCL